jgi:small-conductance mechanosensitive channel
MNNEQFQKKLKILEQSLYKASMQYSAALSDDIGTSGCKKRIETIKNAITELKIKHTKELHDHTDTSKNESHSPYTFRDLLTETLDRAATEAKIKSYEEQIAKLSEFFDNLDEKYYHKDKVDIKKKELRNKIEELKSKIRDIKE